MTKDSQISYDWTRLEDLWPHLDPKEGLICRVSVSDEESLLLLACALPDEERSGWRLSLMLEDRHVGKRGFHSCEAVQAHAERVISGYLRQYHLLDLATSKTIFDDPLHEVIAQLVILLDDDVQIAHITEYRREWVAVSVSLDRTSVRDYAFARDSDGVLGLRTQLDGFVGYDLEDPRHRSVRAPWLATVSLCLPRGEAELAVFRDPTSRWLFGVDTSFQKRDDLLPNPFLPLSFLSLADGKGGRTETVRCSALLVPEGERTLFSTGRQCATPVRFVGAVTLYGLEAGQENELQLFEAERLFAIETAFLRRGNRAVLNPFGFCDHTVLDLPDSFAAGKKTVPQEVLAVLRTS